MGRRLLQKAALTEAEGRKFQSRGGERRAATQKIPCAREDDTPVIDSAEAAKRAAQELVEEDWDDNENEDGGDAEAVRADPAPAHQAGSFSDQTHQQFGQFLKHVTQARMDTPLVL